MPSRLRSLILRRGPLEPLYGPGEEGALEEEERATWQVGARYEVLKTLALHERPDVASQSKGALKPGTAVLILALSPFPAADGEEVLMGYLADTRPPMWLAGWASLGPASVSSPRQLEDPPLGGTRLKGSWEFGGRYRVRDKLLLRGGVELESPEVICELQKHEEVLIVELGLVFREREPRLRARVRADSGELGWLTVEVPDRLPLLDPLNLYSAAAIKPGLFRRTACRAPSVARTTVAGTIEVETWEIGGRYRLLAKTALRTDAELHSPVIASLKRGTLVTVQDIKNVQWHPNVEESVRLQVVIDRQSLPALVGWISTASSTGEPVLDVRDHLEFKKYLTSQGLFEFPESELLSLRLQRPEPGCPLGVAVDHEDGRTLLVRGITPKGLFADWNASCGGPPNEILPGDRIVFVNGRGGSADALLEEMKKDILELTLHRSSEAGFDSGRGSEVVDEEFGGGVSSTAGGENSGGDGAAMSMDPSAQNSSLEAGQYNAPPHGTWNESADDDSQRARWRESDDSPNFGAGTSGGHEEPWPEEDEDVDLDEPQAKLGAAGPAGREGAGDRAAPARARREEKEWRPVGVCVEEAPDCKLFGDCSATDKEESERECRPCGKPDGLLASLFHCGAAASCGQRPPLTGTPSQQPPQPRGWQHLKASGACASSGAFAGGPSPCPGASLVRGAAAKC